MTTDLTTAISLESKIHSKQVNLINVKLVKETSVLYKSRKIDSSTDAVELTRNFIENSDREQLILCFLSAYRYSHSIYGLA
ncbi:hypothetical protein [Clostridium thailandense]|uniref:hypothetical protein n=1 Tax=Clostridium thailandense TaxID=2794346 RepID=UPI00398902F4